MFNPRSAKVFLLVCLIIGSMVGCTGCAPLVFLAANPVITAAVIAAIPAIITVASNAKVNKDQMDVKRLEAETARTNALTTSAEKLNQQVVAQRQLELELIDKQTKTTDPVVRQQLANLQAKVAQDQQVIAQTLNTANAASTNLANDTGTLPGVTGSTSVAPINTGSTTTPLTPGAAGNPTAPASTGNVTPPGAVAPLIPDAGTAIAPAAAAAAPAVAPATAEAPFNPAAGGVSPAAIPNAPPVLGTSAN